MKTIHSFLRDITVLVLLFLPTTAFSAEKADSVVVVKSEKKLYLYKAEHVLASYSVVFGANPTGHKQQQGDERTPEGRYTLDFKKSDSAYHRAIRISYPNAQDIENAKKRGVDPGGSVMIHGQKNGFSWASFLAQRFNWTNGCIALANADMDAVWEAVEAGTPIEIKP